MAKARIETSTENSVRCPPIPSSKISKCRIIELCPYHIVYPAKIPFPTTRIRLCFRGPGQERVVQAKKFQTYRQPPRRSVGKRTLVQTLPSPLQHVFSYRKTHVVLVSHFCGVPLKVAFRTGLEKRRDDGLSCRVADERTSGVSCASALGWEVGWSLV